MSETIDLTLLAQEKIKIKFDEDTIFQLNPEPSIGFTNKMMAYNQKIEKAKTDEDRIAILQEVVTMILAQDESHDVTEDFIEKLHISQVEAVFSIYHNQTQKNKNNPN